MSGGTALAVGHPSLPVPPTGRVEMRHCGHRCSGAPRSDVERGSATILVLAVVAVAVIVALALGLIARAEANRAAAQAGADLGALAAVDVLLSGGTDPCAAARDVMRRLSVAIEACDVADDGVVSVRSRRTDSTFHGLGSASARARAGPDYLADLYRSR